MARPVVSIIIANYCGAKTLGGAIESALSQTVRNVEVLVSDDASTDQSVEIARAIAADDPRVRVIAATENGGPGAARNRALDLAQGIWVAILDADDLMHPARLEVLIDRAEAERASGILDDLLLMTDAGYPSGQVLFGDAPDPSVGISAEDFVRANTARSGGPPLGYAKPLFRRRALGALGYDESARIAEDYEFLLMFLLSGARVIRIREPLYFYRQHDQSISHRLSVDKVQEMLESHDRVVSGLTEAPVSLRAALDARRAALAEDLAYEQLVQALKSRRTGSAVSALLGRPRLLSFLATSAREKVARRRAPPAPPPPSERLVLADSPPEWLEPSDKFTSVSLESVAQDASSLAVEVSGAAQVVACGSAGTFALGFAPKWRRAALLLGDAPSSAGLALPTKGVRFVAVEDPLRALADATNKTHTDREILLSLRDYTAIRPDRAEAAVP